MDLTLQLLSRCRQSFESILYFYQSKGSLIQPVNVGQGVFMDEVKFFRLPIHDALKSADYVGGVDTGVQSLTSVPRVGTVLQRPQGRYSG